MRRRGGSGPVSGPLEIGLAAMGMRLVSLAGSAVGVSRLARDRSHITAAVGTVLLAGVLAVIALAVARFVRLRGLNPLLRLDDAGITLFDGRTVGWGEIAEVREVKGGGLAFLAKGSAELPAFAPVLLRASAEGVARRRVKRYGTPLVLFPQVLDASKEEIVAAVRRYGGGVPLTSDSTKAVTA